MPIYEYKCKECNHPFEALVYGSQKAECPKCHSHKLEPKLSVFAVSAKTSAGSARGEGLESLVGIWGNPRGQDPARCRILTSSVFRGQLSLWSGTASCRH